jgi:hypothetical protein
MDEQYQGLSTYLSVSTCLSDVLCLNSKCIKSNAYKTHKFTNPLPEYAKFTHILGTKSG